jgi:tRNA A37 threonylcarbamoyladenosine dehydratase
MQFDRLVNMIGKEKFAELKQKRLIVFGLGGVGSFAAEALVRSGIQTIYVVDYDQVEITNINRQLIALNSTIGEYKVDVFKKRALDINPKLKCVAYKVKADRDTIKEILDQGFDYVLDCVDDLSAKFELAKYCNDNQIDFLAAMGFANKFKPELIKIAKLNQTQVCPLAKALRKKLKLAGYSMNFEVVYSEEKPAVTLEKHVLGSNAYCPSAAGLIMAAHVVNKLIGVV